MSLMNLLKGDFARDVAVDGAKASPVVLYMATALNGVDWPAVAAAFAALYSALLIGEKIFKWWVQPLLRRLKAARAEP